MAVLHSCGTCGKIGPERHCPEHAPAPRPNARQRGYDGTWDRKRKAFLTQHPVCVLCGGPANVADHYPLSRKQLVWRGYPDPDAEHHLRPLCHRPGVGKSCHSRETARNQPGGWNSHRRG